jgi:hypothetical protein
MLTYPTKAQPDNGKLRLFTHDIDGRTKIAKRYKEICRLMARDAGGADRLSEAKAQLIRRFAAVAVLAEQLEAKLASGDEIDVQEHSLLCSSAVRLAAKIGIGRTAKNIVPSLSDYLEHDANHEQQTESEDA